MTDPLDESPYPAAGQPLAVQLGIAINDPGAVVERGRVWGRGGGIEPVKAWQISAVKQVLTDHGVDVNNTFLPEGQVPAVQYLVWSHDRSSWWCAGGAGYTTHITSAGRFDLEEAQQRANGRSWVRPTSPADVVVRAPTPGLLASPELDKVMQDRIFGATRAAIAARRDSDNARAVGEAAG